MKARFWYVGHPQGFRGVDDEVSPARSYTPFTILVIGSTSIPILWALGAAKTWVLGIALALLIGYVIWRTLAIGPRLALYRLLKRRQ